jgi:hypothetical protein
MGAEGAMTEPTEQREAVLRYLRQAFPGAEVSEAAGLPVRDAHMFGVRDGRRDMRLAVSRELMSRPADEIARRLVALNAAEALAKAGPGQCVVMTQEGLRVEKADAGQH